MIQMLQNKGSVYMAIKGQIDLETGESKRTGGKIHQKPYNYRDDRKEVATILVDMLRDASNGDKKLAHGQMK